MGVGKLLSWIVCSLALLLLAGCSVEPTGNKTSGGPKFFGERCQQTEDCASLICVRLDETGGICSLTCQTADSCPRSENWDCLAAPNESFGVCACLPLAAIEICGDGLDNDCDGKVDDCRICDGRPVPADDHDNCGACGVACRSDQSCERGSCVCIAGAPDECAGNCTSLSTDAQNCGACGLACRDGQRCQLGSCVCSDPSTPDVCPVDGCVNLQHDNDNCGSCGEQCRLGRECVAGSCTCQDLDAPDFCEVVGCVDLDQDENNCGECGNACVAEQVCMAGECSCQDGKILCDGACVDARSDKQHCGACDTACAAVQACVAGECSCTGAQLSACEEGCANLSNDVDNCGKCGSECAAGEVCSAGECLCQSAVYCGSVCQPEGDPQNCGACGNACLASQYCDVDECVCQGLGLLRCGDECLNLDEDEQHCGACDNPCRSGESCSEGECECATGQRYCENAGTCVSVASDEANCGACDAACDPTEQCNAGNCQCPLAGQEYCASEGKCVDTLANTKHCGDCDAPCKATQVCSSGSCDCSGANEEHCPKANACVNLWTDSKNCGACDTVCPAKTHCANSKCICDTVGQVLCGSSCIDLQTNAQNCGACGNVCPTNYVCSAGTCQCPDPTVGVAVRLTNNALQDQRAFGAWNGSLIGVAYLRQIAANGSDYNLRFALLNPDGSVVKDMALTSYTAGASRTVGSTFVGASLDQVGVASNGDEFAVVYVDWDRITPERAVRFVRISAAGVVGATVVVASDAELPSAAGPAVVWSPTYGGYIISGTINRNVFYRRIGAEGTALETPVLYGASYCNTSLGIAPDGRAAIGCVWDTSNSVGYVEPDGSLVEPTTWLGSTDGRANTETLWDGTTLDTLVVRGSGVYMNRYGSSASQYVVIPQQGAVIRVGMEATWIANSLAVATLNGVNGAKLELERVTMIAGDVLTPRVKKIHGPIDIVSTARGKAELVKAGADKLLAIWPDTRHGTTTELYAAPIDLKSCPLP